eukprot:2394524-Rhodomonas_salina.1
MLVPLRADALLRTHETHAAPTTETHKHAKTGPVRDQLHRRDCWYPVLARPLVTDTGFRLRGPVSYTHLTLPTICSV